MMLIGLAAAGCAKKEKAVTTANEQTGDPSPVQPMLAAVMHGTGADVRRLAEQHKGLDERYPPNQSTPMVWAATVDQWPMVEILIDHGSNIWAHDEFGITAAQRTLTSRILRGSAEDAARLRVIDKLKSRGYPYPPPSPEEVVALDRAGKWPPAGVAR